MRQCRDALASVVRVAVSHCHEVFMCAGALLCTAHCNCSWKKWETQTMRSLPLPSGESWIAHFTNPRNLQGDAEFCKHGPLTQEMRRYYGQTRHSYYAPLIARHWSASLRQLPDSSDSADSRTLALPSSPARDHHAAGETGTGLSLSETLQPPR